jgi:hypothetical protein
MILLLYKIALVIFMIYVFYILKYTNRIHMREKARRFGLQIYLYLIKKVPSYMTIERKLYRLLLCQIMIFTDTIIGFLEGITNQEPTIMLKVNNEIEIQTDDIIPEPPEEKIITQIVEKPILINNVDTETINKISDIMISYLKENDTMKPIILTKDKINDKLYNLEESDDTGTKSDNILIIDVQNKLTLDPITDSLDIYEKYKQRDKTKIIKVKKTDINQSNVESPFIKVSTASNTSNNGEKKNIKSRKIKKVVQENFITEEDNASMTSIPSLSSNYSSNLDEIKKKEETKKKKNSKK